MSTDNNNLQKIRKIRFNTIWLVPLIALMIAGWMVYVDWSTQGPEITLIAQTADGLEAGKTKVKARSVDVGTVSSVRLSDDFKETINDLAEKCKQYKIPVVGGNVSLYNTTNQKSIRPTPILLMMGITE